jgi:hypothetical protein
MEFHSPSAPHQSPTKSPTYEILSLKGDLGKVYEGILEAVMEIAEHLRYSTSNKIQTTNDFGDVQLD